MQLQCTDRRDERRGGNESDTRCLAEARVLVVGAGGLGSPVALQLAEAGIGTLVILDPDVVEPSNLNRQTLYRTRDVGRSKAEAARDRLAADFPNVRVEAHAGLLHADNAVDMIRAVDFVVDATDGVAGKFLVNDAAVLARRPYSHAGVLGFVGQTMTVVPETSACYRCLFPEPPPADAIPSCREAGIVGAVAGVIGSIQAGETIKFLLGSGSLLTNRLFTYDAISGRGRTVDLARNPACPLCGDSPSITTLATAAHCGAPERL